MKNSTLVPISDGVEDIETAVIIDVLRRAEVPVTVASVHTDRSVIEAARGMRIMADCALQERIDEDWSLLVLPGGLAGAENFRNCTLLIDRLRAQRDGGGLFAAICASPAVALAPHGLLEGYRATCYPTMAKSLGAEFVDQPVVTDRNCVTSQGPGTAIAFALQLVTLVCNAETSEDIRRQMLADTGRITDH